MALVSTVRPCPMVKLKEETVTTECVNWDNNRRRVWGLVWILMLGQLPMPLTAQSDNLKAFTSSDSSASSSSLSPSSSFSSFLTNRRLSSFPPQFTSSASLHSNASLPPISRECASPRSLLFGGLPSVMDTLLSASDQVFFHYCFAFAFAAFFSGIVGGYRSDKKVSLFWKAVVIPNALWVAVLSRGFQIYLDVGPEGAVGFDTLGKLNGLWMADRWLRFLLFPTLVSTFFIYGVAAVLLASLFFRQYRLSRTNDQSAESRSRPKQDDAADGVGGKAGRP
eukprot:GHVS01062690.1.p1 GENE.GHVS01062690.1~~GHVS01062690.1.p1  ORF type:complete len:280 (-),score=32.63 GHVS01062690.1:237-1076(-)